jgi:putative flippase GtrA
MLECSNGSGLIIRDGGYSRTKMVKKLGFLNNYFQKFWKFTGVSIVATLVDWAVFVLFIPLMDYKLAVVLSYIIGGIIGFIGMRVWVFKVRDNIAKRIAIFAMVNISALLFTLAFMYLFVEHVGLSKIISRVLVTGIVAAYNFTMHKYVTFTSP